MFNPKNKIIARGAEAVLYVEDGKLIKERISKGYRVKELDNKLRKIRKLLLFIKIRVKF